MKANSMNSRGIVDVPGFLAILICFPIFNDNDCVIVSSRRLVVACYRASHDFLSRVIHVLLHFVPIVGCCCVGR